eukprot:9070602-Prorocentrum_lima.AAC.1
MQPPRGFHPTGDTWRGLSNGWLPWRVAQGQRVPHRCEARSTARTHGHPASRHPVQLPRAAPI